MPNKLSYLGQEKKSVGSMLACWEGWLHVQLSALFEQQVSLCILCICWKSWKQSTMVHCKVSSSSELLSFLNHVNEKGHNTALASFAPMGPATILTGTLISPGRGKGKSCNSWGSKTAPSVWISRKADKDFWKQTSEKNIFGYLLV